MISPLYFEHLTAGSTFSQLSLFALRAWGQNAKVKHKLLAASTLKGAPLAKCRTATNRILSIISEVDSNAAMSMRGDKKRRHLKNAPPHRYSFKIMKWETTLSFALEYSNTASLGKVSEILSLQGKVDGFQAAMLDDRSYHMTPTNRRSWNIQKCPLYSGLSRYFDQKKADVEIMYASVCIYILDFGCIFRDCILVAKPTSRPPLGHWKKPT